MAGIHLFSEKLWGKVAGMFRTCSIPIVIVALLARSGLVVAQTESPSPSPSPSTPTSAPTCDQRNLLRSVAITATGIGGDTRLVNDGRLAIEGSAWNHLLALTLPTTDSELAFDLGRVEQLQYLLLQGDANDVYSLEASEDGRVYRQIWQIPIKHGKHGLRSRTIRLTAPIRARFLRLQALEGDKSYSVAEFRAYCRKPTPWPPPSILISNLVAKKHAGTSIFWRPVVINSVKAGLAVMAFLLVAWALVLRRAGQPQMDQKLRDGILIAVGLLSIAGYFNLFNYHSGRFVHTWEFYHYYVGAKYSPELGFTRLYDCTVAADVDAGLGSRAAKRTIRNLRSNTLESAAAAVANTADCKKHFEPERWTEFKADVAYFRRKMSSGRWSDLQKDHGYNATPVWGALGRLMASTGPASDSQIFGLALLDPLLFAAMWAAVWWAFGWRMMIFAIIFWGTNYPARFFWNGGAYLRMDWLALSIISICLLRKERHFWGGAAITYATLLRIFPGFIVVGLILKVLAEMLRRKTFYLSSGHKRFAVGCITAMAVLVGISGWAAGSYSSWGEFYQNSRKHLSTPLTNNMGLKTVVAYQHQTRAQMLKDDKLREPFKPWKEARVRVFKERQILFFLLVGGFLFLLFRAVRDQEDWVAATLGITLIPVATELTCYYYSILLGLAFLWPHSKGIVFALFGYSALTWACFGIWGWYDAQFTWMSLLTIVFLVYCLWSFQRPRAAVESSNG